MPIGWNGLSIPSEACSVHMPIVITNFKVRGIKQDSIPYMMKVILTHILKAILKVINDSGHAHRTCFTLHAQPIPTNRHVHKTIGHIGHAQTSEHVHRTS